MFWTLTGEPVRVEVQDTTLVVEDKVSPDKIEPCLDMAAGGDTSVPDEMDGEVKVYPKGQAPSTPPPQDENAPSLLGHIQASLDQNDINASLDSSLTDSKVGEALIL